MEKVLNHFQSNDKDLYFLVKRIGLLEITKTTNYFESLCEEIISQQLSGNVSDVIFKRLKNLFPGEILEPIFLLAIPTEQLREIGLSYQKASYLKNLSTQVINKSLRLEELDSLDDENVIKTLILVKGIGRWTAEMFLMFSLGREDVFSYGDLGLRKGIQKLYGFSKEPTLKQMEHITKKWSPYRTYASLALWKSLAS